MRKLAPFAALVFVAAAGCKPSPEKIVQGNWKVSEVKLPPAVEKNPMAKMLKGMFESSTLKVEESKKYTLTFGPLPIEGKWAISEKSLTLTPETAQGKPISTLASQPGAGAIANPMTFTLSEDNKTLSVTNQGSTLVFTKVAG